MTISSFWTIPPSPAFQTPGDVALQNLTPKENLPYTDVAGITGTNTPLLLDGAQRLFPVADGVTNKLRDFQQYPVTGTPPHFNDAPTELSSTGTDTIPGFTAWATGYQLEYLKKNTFPIPLIIGSNSSYDPNSVPIHAMLSADGMKVYILENLQKTDLSKMSVADQRLIANTDYFKTVMSVQMGLIPSSTPIPAISPTIDNTAGAVVAMIATDNTALSNENKSTGVSSGTVRITVQTASGAANFDVSLGGQTSQSAVTSAFSNATAIINGVSTTLGSLLNIGYDGTFRLTFSAIATTTDFAIQDDLNGSTASTLADLGLSMAASNTPITISATVAKTGTDLDNAGGGVGVTGTVHVVVTTNTGPIDFAIGLFGASTQGEVISRFENNGTSPALGDFLDVSFPGNKLTFTPKSPSVSFSIDSAKSTAQTLADLGITTTVRNLTAALPVNQTASGNIDVSSVMNARTEMINAIAGTQAIVINTTNTNVSSAMKLTADAGQVFVDELENLKARVATMSIFSVQDIKDQIAAITTRFNQLKAFGTVSLPTQNGDQWTGVISSDNNVTINNGYDKLLAAEKRILQIDNKVAVVASTGALPGGGSSTDKHLDVPGLIFLFQLNANLTLEQVNAVNTEIVNQQNALLKTYSMMQQVIHDTEASFNFSNTNDQNQKKFTLYGLTEADNKTIHLLVSGTGDNNKPSPQLSTVQMQIISMFEKELGTQVHPIEALESITRNKFDLYDQTKNPVALVPWLSSRWSEFGNMLSENVTSINQNNQMQMNDINSLQKQKDRHFDLANNSLSKAADIIQSIGRNVA